MSGLVKRGFQVVVLALGLYLLGTPVATRLSAAKIPNCSNSHCSLPDQCGFGRGYDCTLYHDAEGRPLCRLDGC
jgi:hypothetical protein